MYNHVISNAKRCAMVDEYTFELSDEQFEKVLQGKKDIELAVNDAKRKNLAVGNQITFQKVLKEDNENAGVDQESDEQTSVKATIENLMYFAGIEEATQMLGKERCGFKPNSTFDKATDTFLSKEKYELIEKNGIVAIVFKLLEG